MEKTTFVIADDFGGNYVIFENPITGQEVEMSGELISGYYHENEDGTYSERKWFANDITHCKVHEEDNFVVLAKVN